MTESNIITDKQIEKRRYWVDEILKLSGNFGDDADKVEKELTEEIKREGVNTLIGHLRLCGAIPEKYRHDSTEEKLYSKYTDIVIARAFDFLEIPSIVIKERADSADVECVCDNYKFVADAKAFRLSRTAKNQKDFKVQAMDGWKRDKPYAMLVCPIYQLPSRNSQIYEQAASRSVCVFSYTHLSVLIRFASLVSNAKAKLLLGEIFQTIETLNPSKDAISYWQTINRSMVNFHSSLRDIWNEEKKSSSESISFAKEEGLTYFASERSRLMGLSREDAIKEILKASKIESKIQAIKSVADNGLLTMI